MKRPRHSRRIVANWLLGGVLLGGGLLGGCRDEGGQAQGEKDSKGASARPPPTGAHARKQLTKRWAQEARILARRHPTPPITQKDSQDTRSNEWATEAEARLSALLMDGKAARRWATFGLGRRCNEKTPRINATLTTSLASWAAGKTPPSESLLALTGWAIGSCASENAERTLHAWLDPGHPLDDGALGPAAAIGLGRLADQQRKLTEQTQVALLDAARQRKNGALLYPLARLTRLSDAVGAHLLEVAGDLLTQPKTDQRTVILALGSAGAQAAPALGQVLLSRDDSPAEQSAAAQALGRLGAEGQEELDSSLAQLLARGIPQKATDPLWAPLRATLQVIRRVRKSAPQLRKLSTLPVPQGKAPLKRAQKRRLLWLRCRAADLRAHDRPLSPVLLSCDPDQGPIFQLAQVRVLARSRIEGQRLEIFQTLARSDDPRVAQAALRLIPGHPEIPKIQDVFLRALQSGNPGTQATASKIIAAYPNRAHPSQKAPSAPDQRIVQALGALLEKSSRLPDETLAAAVSAAGALASLTLKPLLIPLCEGPRAALHAPTERALALLGSPKRRCGAQKEPEVAEKETPPAPTKVIEFDSPFGALTLVLDEPHTARARQKVVELAQKGHYTDGPLHDLSPGSAVQFGDPNGDGYEEYPLRPSPLELTPSAFGPLSVGISSFSERSMGTQLFVTLANAPQLRGTRVRLGHAKGPWHLLWPGDPLQNARVRTTQ